MIESMMKPGRTETCKLQRCFCFPLVNPKQTRTNNIKSKPHNNQNMYSPLSRIGSSGGTRFENKMAKVTAMKNNIETMTHKLMSKSKSLRCSHANLTILKMKRANTIKKKNQNQFMFRLLFFEWSSETGASQCHLIFESLRS